ncbi:MAG: hypothetical protein CVU61_16060 [Deltaproteobacteria bacterium HGW-Deltaproteobacteria-19]|jgi:hypothetical protein|nr:MAG: hypothetical protein CVU61_16060 [Deltaproteobacteria bacterium HGW-Deltaproteobacteria-19]
MGRFFTPSQVQIAGGAFSQAESLVGRHFRITGEDMKAHRYDVKTLAFLENHEVRDEAFAHLCKYQVGREKEGVGQAAGMHFYRVCLQDHRILDAVERGTSFIRLTPLLLYIAAHELVHIIRFDRGEIDFNAPETDKEKEEEKVHGITRTILQGLRQPEVGIVAECFDSRYRLGDWVN